MKYCLPFTGAGFPPFLSITFISNMGIRYVIYKMNNCFYAYTRNKLYK